MLEKNLRAEREVTLKLDGRNVKFIEYEPANEGDFVKVCTYDHGLGVAGEYAWFRNKYHNAEVKMQQLTTIVLNGKKIECDILTILIDGYKERKIYFDISQMMESLNDMASGKINKEHWEENAKTIYDKLVNDFGFSVNDDDKECLSKKIGENINIGFDISYFFGFVIENSALDRDLRKKCLGLLNRFRSSDFIGKTIVTEKIIGGYIKIDDLNDLNIVFENYKKLEEESLNLITK